MYDNEPTIVLDPTNGFYVEKWAKNLDAAILSSPVAADLNRDGYLEIIVGTEAGFLYCLNYKNGDKNWDFPSGKPIHSSPTVCDINNDQELEIIFSTIGNVDSYLYCLDKMGGELWKYEIHDIDGSTPTIADLNNDNFYEILIGSGNELLCINSDGTKRWNYTTIGTIACSPTITDFGDNKSYDILIMDESIYTYCLSGNGDFKWKIAIAGESSPIVADLESDGVKEIILGTKSGILGCIFENKSLNWGGGIDLDPYNSFPLTGYPALGNIDSYNELEIIVNYGHFIGYFDYQGKNIWNTTSTMKFTSSSVLADINSEGEINIITGYDNGICCFDADGTNLWLYETLDEVKTTPFIGDINKDHKLEVIFGCDNHNLYCITLDSSVIKSGSTPWYCFGGSITHSGNLDSDLDLLDDLLEGMIGTNINNYDTDTDLLNDGMEYFCSTNPFLKDTDNDKLEDGTEIYVSETDPLDWDSDNDYLSDYWEWTHNSNPNRLNIWLYASMSSPITVPLISSILIMIVNRILIVFNIRTCIVKNRAKRIVYRNHIKNKKY